MCLLTQVFKDYRTPSDKDFGMYGNVAEKTLALEAGGYNLVLLAATYISGFAFLISFMVLACGRKKTGSAMAEIKGMIAKVCLVTGLIFGVTGLMNIIQAIAMKY